jgi:FixJ family two-component response regulator
VAVFSAKVVVPVVGRTPEAFLTKAFKSEVLICIGGAHAAPAEPSHLQDPRQCAQRALDVFTIREREVMVHVVCRPLKKQIGVSLE